jgi:hypothetical protein
MQLPTPDMSHMDELQMIQELTGRKSCVIGDWY